MSRKAGFLVFFIAAALVLSAAVYVIRDLHRIDCIGEDITDCPKYARKGTAVTVRTISVTDGYMELYLDGAEIEPDQEGVFSFVMPDHRVRITSRFVGYDPDGSPAGKAGTEMPEQAGKKAVRVIYDRMWIYGLRAETEDRETVDLVASILGGMVLSTKAEKVSIEDFTDRVTLVYEDGSSMTYVFDGGYYYSPEDKMHYQVLSGMNELSTVLDCIVKGSGENGD